MSNQRVVTDSMIGLKMADYSRISPRVATVLGQNPSPFTGPGTNTYIVGTSKRPILLDTGQGVAIYADLLETALKELSASSELERIVLTHAHVDHLGGVKQVTERFGEMEVLKMPWEGHDAPAGEISAIGHDAVVHTEGATRRFHSWPFTRSPVLLSRRRTRSVHGGRRAGGWNYSHS
jgi:glyoxylase-like metal-dependent hydrolase (beta-lactamase superfamily II)